MGHQGTHHRPGRQRAHAHPGLTGLALSRDPHPFEAPAGRGGADVADERLGELLRALGHEERRRLLRACLGEARAAGELTARSGLAPASVSEHLKVLRKTGLLVLERRGRFRYYRADPAVVEEAASGLRALADERV